MAKRYSTISNLMIANVDIESGNVFEMKKITSKELKIAEVTENDPDSESQSGSLD